jgi:hypothetical protein
MGHSPFGLLCPSSEQRMDDRLCFVEWGSFGLWDWSLAAVLSGRLNEVSQEKKGLVGEMAGVGL